LILVSTALKYFSEIVALRVPASLSYSPSWNLLNIRHSQLKKPQNPRMNKAKENKKILKQT
jgi:hypothetical protein